MKLAKADDARLGASLVCLVIAKGCHAGSTPEGLLAELNSLASQRGAEDFPPARIKDAVRDMLRAGGYKPAGRQKPASEYLAQAAREGRFPSINAPVDCNNLLSLDTGLPISLLDLRALGEQALVRIAAEGESYVFNAAGHDMDLAGLLCVCAADGSPLGNPVKDSMAGKLKEDSQDYAGFIYAPPSLYAPDALKAVGERFADLLRRYCGAAEAFVAAVV
jgi:DNA/RNA-binding domain of Phe-tRNA-synthetase-like protein